MTAAVTPIDRVASIHIFWLGGNSGKARFFGLNALSVSMKKLPLWGLSCDRTVFWNSSLLKSGLFGAGTMASTTGAPTVIKATSFIQPRVTVIPPKGDVHFVAGLPPT